MVGSIRTSVSTPAGLVTITEAFTASWPSRNTVARISNSSPTEAFAAYAPPSITGDTLVTGIRPIRVPSPAVAVPSEAVDTLAAGSSMVAAGVVEVVSVTSTSVTWQTYRHGLGSGRGGGDWARPSGARPESAEEPPCSAP